MDKKRREQPEVKSMEIFCESIVESFSAVGDPRVRRKRIQHRLDEIFVITLCAVLCGANTLKEVAAYAKSRSSWLKGFLELRYGVPCYTTFWLVYSMLDPQEFQNSFTHWISKVADLTAESVFAIDGKALRGTAVSGQPQSFVHTVSLWACDNQLTLGQVKVDRKSNEITAIPKLLELIDLSGATVTIDAMGTQTGIAEKIVNSGANYILAVKRNHPNLYDELENFFLQALEVNFEGVKHSSYHMNEEGHGRLEKRSVYVTEEIAWLPDREKWVGLRSIVLLVSERTVKAKTTVEKRMFLTTLPPDARKTAYAIRSHWGIENGCHWVLDVAFHEDKIRARTGYIAENLSILRKMAQNLLKQDKKTDGGIELKRKKAAWDPGYLLRLIAIKSS